MKKYKNVIIAVIVIILVFLGTFLISKYCAKKPLEEINYKEYLELKDEKETKYILISSEDKKDEVESFAKNQDMTIYYLNIKDLNDDELKNIYGDDEVVNMLVDNNKKYTFIGDFKEYKLTKDFMDKKIIDRDIITITADDYVNIIKEDKYNLMFIGSATCGYCTMFKPELKSILDEYDVNIYYIDLSKASQNDLATLYATDSYLTTEEWGTPLTFLYKDGKRIDVINGYVPASEVLSVYKKHGVI